MAVVDGMDRFMHVESALDADTQLVVYAQLVGEDVPFWFYRIYQSTVQNYFPDYVQSIASKYIVLDSNSHYIQNEDEAKQFVEHMKRFGINKLMYAIKATSAVYDLRLFIEKAGLVMDGFITLHHKRDSHITYDAIVLRLPQ